MKAYLVIILSVFVLIIAFSISHAEATVPQAPPRPFSSGEGRFTIETPGHPQLTHTAHPSFIGTIHVYTYRVRTPEANYSLAYTDIPKIGIFFAGPKSVLRKAKNGFLKNTKGQEIDFYPRDYQGNQGMELKFKLFGKKPGDKNNGVALFYLVKNRVYILVVTYTRAPADWPIERFLDSFQLVKKA